MTRLGGLCGRTLAPATGTGCTKGCRTCVASQPAPFLIGDAFPVDGGRRNSVLAIGRSARFSAARPSGMPMNGPEPCRMSDGPAPARKAIPAPRLSPALRWRREVRFRETRRPPRRRPRVEIRPAVPHDASEAMKGGTGTVHPISLEGAGGKPEKVRRPPRAQELDRVIAHVASSARHRPRRNGPPVRPTPVVREAPATGGVPLACGSRCPTMGRPRCGCDRGRPCGSASSEIPSSSRLLHADPRAPR